MLVVDGTATVAGDGVTASPRIPVPASRTPSSCR